MGNVLTTDNRAATSAQERLLEIRARLTPNDVLDQEELLALSHRLEKIWFDCPALFVQAAAGTSVQRAIIQGQIRRDIEKLKRDVDAAVRSTCFAVSMQRAQPNNFFSRVP